MNLFSQNQDALVGKFEGILQEVSLLPVEDRVHVLNMLKIRMHEISPMKSEPVDCVLWIPNSQVFSNDYNPNSVAPPEMELLRLSIGEDGYTQPIVSFNQSGDLSAPVSDGLKLEVVDGFHRHRVGKECKEIQARVHGYLPVVQINSARGDKSDRMAATIRHNRARGKHSVDSMSDIVMELKRRNWSDEKIGKELGMEPDEVLRLCQITGLADIFKDREMSEAWEAEIFENELEESL